MATPRSSTSSTNTISQRAVSAQAALLKAIKSTKPDEIEAAEERRVRNGLGMAAEEHRHPDHHREDEPAIEGPLEQKIDGVERGRQHRGHGDEREVQPDVEERTEGERKRAHRRGQLAPPAPSAEEKRERQRDQQLERRLGGEGVAEGEGEGEEAQE